MKKVPIPVYKSVPRWLVLQGEIDHRLYILEQMLVNHKNRPPLSQMIDEATGYDKKLEADALELIEELRYLKREFDKESA